MRHAQFLVLTGRLREFPLYDLLETLRVQRKTGRLLVEFTAGPASFHFSRGALVEAHFGEWRGPEALMLVLSIEDGDASFNFNPLVAAPRSEKTGEVLPVPPQREVLVEVTSASSASAASLPTPRAHPDAYALPPAPGGGEMLERLTQIEKAVAAQSRRANIERAAYTFVIAALVLFAFYWRGRDAGGHGVEAAAPRTPAVEAQPVAQPREPTPPALTTQPPLAEKRPEPLPGGVKKPGRQHAASSQGAAPAFTSGAPAATPPAPSPQPGGQTVQVKLTVEEGKVIRAEVSEPRPGMSAYEALALRLARQRRFPSDFSGQKTLSLKVGR